MKIIRVISFFLFVTTLAFSFYHWFFSNHELKQIPTTINEKFDPSSAAVNTIQEAINICSRSALNEVFDSLKYVAAADSLVKYKFYHGYSSFSMHENYLLHVLGIILRQDISMKIAPDDIINEPKAACSQQAIVFMEVLKRRGFKVRKVGLRSHFCSEVFYNGKWHFFDTDREAEFEDIASVPGIEELMKNKSLLYKAYSNSRTMDSASIERVFNAEFFDTGKVNEFPAKKMLLFQKVIKIMTHILWLFFLILFFLIKPNK